MNLRNNQQVGNLKGEAGQTSQYRMADENFWRCAIFFLYLSANFVKMRKKTTPKVY